MRQRKQQGVCVVEGCDRAWAKRYWCRKHWERWRKFGDPLGFGRNAPVEVRFWNKVVQCGECWGWTGSLGKDGYGSFNAEGSYLAHKWLWTYLYGPVPAGHELDHLCRNRACVRPEHLEVVTHKENMARSSVVKTHCKNGHLLAGENLVQWCIKTKRQCRLCQNAAVARYQQRKRAG